MTFFKDKAKSKKLSVLKKHGITKDQFWDNLVFKMTQNILGGKQSTIMVAQG